MQFMLNLRCNEVNGLIDPAKLIIILILIFSNIAYSQTYLSGETYSFQSSSLQAFQGLSQQETRSNSYLWDASDGTPRSSQTVIFKWTAPIVDSAREVTVKLTVTNKDGCSSKKELKLIVSPQQAQITLKKDCIFSAPVRIGNKVLYTYNVTNSGNASLNYLSIVDDFEWGPSCQPIYIKGDDGNKVLDPGESWWYECSYVVPDPSDYPKLQIMAAPRNPDNTPDIIRKLMVTKGRLEIMMDNLRLRHHLFDIRVASLVSDYRIINEVNYTFYNYTNEMTGEFFSKVIDPEGKLNKTIYSDSISGAVLTTRYDLSGNVTSEEIHVPKTKEYLNIQYDLPYLGYRTYTVIDYNSGDTLVIVVDLQGDVLSKEYRKTPGYRPYIDRFSLKNTATVKAKTLNGEEISDSDSFTLEVFNPLPILKVTKEADANLVRPDSTLNYTITYANVGGADAHEVVLRETYDMSMIFLRADKVPDSGTINQWTLGDLNVGESGKIKVEMMASALASSGSKITNIVNLTCKERSSDQASINTTVGQVGLNITKSASAKYISVGNKLSYTITYQNDGLVKQTNVVIHDYLDKNVDLYNPPTPKNDAPRPGDPSNYLRWNIGDLNPGDGGVITITVIPRESSIKENVTSIINAYGIGSTQQDVKNATLETFTVRSLWIKKTADKSSYYRDENITYTINYGNAGQNTAFDVNITDILPKVDLVSVSPATNSLGNIMTWKIGTLDPLKNGTITVIVHIPKKPNIKFDETSSVQGKGYVYVRKMLSTEEEKPSLTNWVNISGYYIEDQKIWTNATSSSTVTIVGAAGTKIINKEHGSGHYEEDEKTSLRFENKSITLDKNIFAKYGKTSFSLPGNRKINYQSLWSDFTKAENHVLNDLVSENYMYIDTLKKNNSFQVDMNQTVYKSEGNFMSGMAQINYQKHRQNSTDVTQEINENYHGTFKVLQSIDSYGDNVNYAKSSKGKGFVSSDKSTTGLQRSSEHGSGYYSSEETSQLGLVEKYTKMIYEPTNLTVGSRNLRYANLWNEQMWTKDPEKGLLIHEEILHASQIDKEAQMDKSALSTIEKFNGTMNIEMVKGNSIDLEQTFVGSYQINTTISVYTAPKHLYPHINISKEAVMLDENTVLFLINVTNDGNKPFKPLNVIDHLPDGLSFINSSIRPDVNGQIINWTIPSLDISRTMIIELRAKITYVRHEYINMVTVEARYKDAIIVANNFTKFDAYYQPLPCCLSKDHQDTDAKTSETTNNNHSVVVNLILEADLVPINSSSEQNSAQELIGNLLYAIDVNKLNITILVRNETAAGAYSRPLIANLGVKANHEMTLASSRQDLGSLPLSEQVGLIKSWKKNLEDTKFCVGSYGATKVNVNGFRSQYLPGNDTLKALQDNGFLYDAGFQAGLVYMPGHENGTWPYLIQGTNVYAVPVSSALTNGKLISLQDRKAKEMGMWASQWYNLLKNRFDEASRSDEPMVIVFSSSNSASGEYFNAYNSFIEYAINNNAAFVTTTELVDMTRSGQKHILAKYDKKAINASLNQGDWGEWKPSPCFNMTTKTEDCFQEIDDYYNELESDSSNSCCASNYEVP